MRSHEAKLGMGFIGSLAVTFASVVGMRMMGSTADAQPSLGDLRTATTQVAEKLKLGSAAAAPSSSGASASAPTGNNASGTASRSATSPTAATRLTASASTSEPPRLNSLRSGPRPTPSIGGALGNSTADRNSVTPARSAVALTSTTAVSDEKSPLATATSSRSPGVNSLSDATLLAAAPPTIQRGSESTGGGNGANRAISPPLPASPATASSASDDRYADRYASRYGDASSPATTTNPGSPPPPPPAAPPPSTQPSASYSALASEPYGNPTTAATPPPNTSLGATSEPFGRNATSVPAPPAAAGPYGASTGSSAAFAQPAMSTTPAPTTTNNSSLSTPFNSPPAATTPLTSTPQPQPQPSSNQFSTQPSYTNPTFGAQPYQAASPGGVPNADVAGNGWSGAQAGSYNAYGTTASGYGPATGSNQASPGPYNNAVGGQFAAIPGNADPYANARPYNVGANENYWTISERVYGSGAYFKAIYEYNRQRFPRADNLKIGDQLQIPDRQTLERLYPDLVPRPQGVPASQVPNTLSFSQHDSPANYRVHVVQAGDTLFAIARNQLGRGSRWLEIYNLNRDQLGADFDNLPVGTQLRLPADQPQQFAPQQPQRNDPVTQRPQQPFYNR